MLVLFVCMGNVYRSRLAEAYLKYLDLRGVHARSAGVEADYNFNGPITTWAAHLLGEYGLEEFGKPTWTQLGQGLLDQADLVICMNRHVYQTAQSKGLKMPMRTVIWDVTDVSTILLMSPEGRQRIPHIARRTFLHIIGRVNELAVYLNRPKPKELVDILAPDGTVTGRTANADVVNAQGLWHRGIHALVYTDAGSALFEKRSQSIVGNPGLWDLTMGGISAAGEDPETTLRRELAEELGIRVTEKQITKLFVWRYSHYMPSYGLHNRSLVHTYLIEIPHAQALSLQESEVADARYLKFRQAADFIAAGRSPLGHLVTSQQYYRKVLSEAERAHHSRHLHPVAA